MVNSLLLFRMCKDNLFNDMRLGIKTDSDKLKFQISTAPAKRNLAL